MHLSQLSTQSMDKIEERLQLFQAIKLWMEEENIIGGCCLPPADSAPWLVYTHENSSHKQSQTFVTLSSPSPYTEHYSKSIPQLRGKSIVSYNDGWLLLRDLSNLLIFTLWNCTSLETIHLPPLNLHHDISCAIVCPPAERCDDRDVGVLVFSSDMAFYYRSHNIAWIPGYTTVLNGKSAEVRDVVICNGVIYGFVSLLYKSRVFYVTIEFNNNAKEIYGLRLTLELLGVEEPTPSEFSTFLRRHLLASCGQVYVVGIYSRFSCDKQICGVSIWVLSLRLRKWVQVKCLQDRTFLVGRKSNTWCWGSNELGGVKRNSVYFEVSSNDPHGVPKALYIYNLENERLTSFLPPPNIPSFLEDPIWILPNYHMLGKDDKYKHRTGAVGLRKQGLQDQNEEHTLLHKSESAQNSNALSLTFKKHKHNDKFLLCDLSIDVIALVPTHMHLFDYMNFRATCKEFRCIAPLARLRENNNSYPLLMLFESEVPRCTLMDPCRNDSCYMVIPKVFGKDLHIDSCKNGWLLLRTNGGVFFHFFNPYTGERRLVPFNYDVASVGFSTSPISPDCVTVGIACADQHAHICYHRSNEETWHECVFGYDLGVVFRSVLRSPVYHKGAFYFWDIRGYLGVFHLANEGGTCSWNVYGKPRTPNGDIDTLHSSYLVECGEELLSVFIGDMGKWVQVFKLDQKKMTWNRVKSLGNHLLFVGSSSSFSAVAKEREMANRIYLPRMRDRCLFYYALDKGKYSTHMSNESFEDFSGTEEHLRCTWIY